MHARVTLAELAALVIGVAVAQAASEDVDALLRSLIGKDDATIEKKFGLPDKTGVRPSGGTFSSGGFDSLSGVLILELRGAEIAER